MLFQKLLFRTNHLRQPASWGKVLLLILIYQAFTLPSLAQNVVINEIMASNQTTIADNDGDYSDWIELHNAGETPLILEGYGLSDNYDNAFKWVFPAVTIGPGQYMIIWASNKDRNNPEEPLHTSYAISADGEEVILTHPNGTRISEIPPTPMGSDISFGHFPDASGTLVFFDIPTPGAPNSQQGFEDILEVPQLSLSSGFYTEEQGLVISHPDPEAAIFYTLDGTIPTLESIPYEGPITLVHQTSNNQGINMIRTNPPETDPLEFGWKTPSLLPEKATVVRAAAFREGYFTPPPATGTYFIDMEPPALPVASIAMDTFNLFNHTNGIYIPGIDYETYGYGENWYGMPNANYFRTGELWEVPSYFSFFESGEEVISENVGVRIHGGGTRALPQKSLRIYARGGYGSDYLNHPFFPNQDHSQYKRILLRSAGQDFFGPGTQLRDGFMEKLVEPIGVPIQDYRPAILYLNGEYWGIQNLRERYDKYYFLRKYGIPEDKLDLLENNMVVVEGSWAHYGNMMDFIDENPLSDPEAYAYINTQMNVENFTDYNIINIFVGNIDWPGHNLKYFRRQTTYNPDAPFGNDGRWHWALNDLDFGFGWSGAYNYDFDMISYVTDPVGGVWPQNLPWSTFLIRNLLQNESFKYGFINRFGDLLNTVFLTEHMLAFLDETSAAIEPEIEKHIARWGYPANTLNEWHVNLNRMANFATLRPGFLQSHLINYFELPGTFSLTLDVNDEAQGSIKINRLHLDASNPLLPGFEGYPWTGKYFSGVPIPLTAIPKQGYRLQKWVNQQEEAFFENPLYVSATEDLSLTAVFEVDDTSAPALSETQLTIFPNPATNRLFIRLPYTTGSFQLQVLSSFGIVVLAKELKHPGSEMELDLSHLSPGIYYIRLTHAKEIRSARLLKL
ncbi:MAG: CotH kinase family protein [Bacteroides sp.]|jgi:hypothetical protein|nr:CotH kinase family protein [Bacteroides sp.]